MKYALITGSTKGIGYAIAEKLSQTGYHVFINGRSENPEIDIAKENYTYIKADLSSLDGMNALTNAILSKTNLLDCLVLNAGATSRKTFTEIEYQDWQYVMDTNVNIPFFLVQKLFPYITDNGSITFISSAMSLKPHAKSIPYGVSKAAVNMLSQTLVKELSPRGIRVNTICPGFIDTMWQKDKPLELRESITKKIALDRFGKPQEIADFCYSIMQNNYINGAIVQVDGGYDFF